MATRTAEILIGGAKIVTCTTTVLTNTNGNRNLNIGGSYLRSRYSHLANGGSYLHSGYRHLIFDHALVLTGVADLDERRWSPASRIPLT